MRQAQAENVSPVMQPQPYTRDVTGGGNMDPMTMEMQLMAARQQCLAGDADACRLVAQLTMRLQQVQGRAWAGPVGQNNSGPPMGAPPMGSVSRR